MCGWVGGWGGGVFLVRCFTISAPGFLVFFVCSRNPGQESYKPLRNTRSLLTDTSIPRRSLSLGFSTRSEPGGCRQMSGFRLQPPLPLPLPPPPSPLHPQLSEAMTGLAIWGLISLLSLLPCLRGRSLSLWCLISIISRLISIITWFTSIISNLQVLPWTVIKSYYVHYQSM